MGFRIEISEKLNKKISTKESITKNMFKKHFTLWKPFI